MTPSCSCRRRLSLSLTLTPHTTPHTHTLTQRSSPRKFIYICLAKKKKVPCSLNTWNTRNCEPTISFQRVDPTGEGVVSTGENFRRTREYYDSEGVLTRDLIKLYGIRLLIKPQGVGAKFNFSTLIVTIGSGLALLSIATLVSDYTLAYLPARLLCCADEKAALLKVRAHW